jgi:predicted DNA-binding transcriptional regulator YafY
LDARLAAEGFQRPADFDLAIFWQAWCAEFEKNRPCYPVTLRIAPDLIPLLSQFFGDPVRAVIEQAPPDAEGRIVLTLPFESLEDARSRILGLGKAIEVLEPEALRLSVMDHAQQIVALYTRSSAP